MLGRRLQSAGFQADTAFRWDVPALSHAAIASRTARLPGDASGDETARSDDDGRLDGDNPFGGMLFTERNVPIVDVVREVAAEQARSMAEVALA